MNGQNPIPGKEGELEMDPSLLNIDENLFKEFKSMMELKQNDPEAMKAYEELMKA